VFFAESGKHPAETDNPRGMSSDHHHAHGRRQIDVLTPRRVSPFTCRDRIRQSSRRNPLPRTRLPRLWWV